MAPTRTLMIALAAVLVCAVAVPQQPSPPTSPPVTDRPLAVVNGVTITEKQLWWAMEQGWGGQILDEMVTDLLLRQAAREAAIKVTDGEVDEALARIRSDYPGKAAFEDMLRHSGMTVKGLRMQLHRDLLIDKLLTRHAGIDEQGLRRYYEAHKAEFVTPVSVHLFDIVTLTLEDAYAVRERLAAGESFSTVAFERSHDPTAKKGGDRGWITPDDVLEDNVRAVVFAMQLGEISDPVQCEDHCHVFYVKQIEPGKALSFENARPEIARLLREKKGVSRELYLSLLKQRARIDVRWKAHAYMNDVYRDLSVIKVVVRGERLLLPRAAELLPNSHLLVPVAAVVTAMGASAEWDEDARALAVTRGEASIKLVVGSSTLATADGEVQMTEAPVVLDGVLMMSPRAPLEALGASVMWNRAENTLYVETRAEAGIPEGPADMPPPLVQP